MFINFVADATYKSFVYTCSRVTLVHSWRVILGDACGGIIVGDAYGGVVLGDTHGRVTWVDVSG